MKYLLIIVCTIFFACADNATSRIDNTEGNTSAGHDHESNNNQESAQMWTADSATKRNVAKLISILDSAEASKNDSKVELATSIQSGLDKLVKDCRMKGQDHDVLHVWLENVIKEIKNLKEGDDPYDEAYTGLRKSVVSFYDKFQ